MDWQVYVLGSKSTARTYVGIALEVAERLSQHNGERPGGAKTTRAGRPWRLLHTYGPYPDRGTAQSIEAQVKRLTGSDRLTWKAADSDS